MMDYPRDLSGYGDTPPQVAWPNGARVAVQFVLNYEEGGENCVLHGDPASEVFLSEIIGAAAFDGARHMSMESIYEYGSRAGVWRILDLFRQRHLPLTVFAVAMAAARHPKVIETALADGHEIAAHGHAPRFHAHRQARFQSPLGDVPPPWQQQKPSAVNGVDETDPKYARHPPATHIHRLIPWTYDAPHQMRLRQ